MNTKDFYNLAEVYLDAVLHPRAVSDPQVLQQEGWHYELRNRSEALEYKGVVYNEMKGVYSSPDAILGRATRRALFPDNAYSQDAGGDPREIPGLGFAQLRDYHAKYYHPSNARFYFYGDDDPLVRLQLLDGELAAPAVDTTIVRRRAHACAGRVYMVACRGVHAPRRPRCTSQDSWRSSTPLTCAAA